MENNNRRGQEETLGESYVGLERLVFFNDAVFAIAITLLVIDIRVPDLPSNLSDAQQLTRLYALLQNEIFPQIRSYVISFLVIGIYWVSHHRLFRYIRRYDGRLIWLNILFLLCIAFLPFPTSFLESYGDFQIAVIFYDGSMIATGLALFLIWIHAVRNRQLGRVCKLVDWEYE